MLCTIIDIVNDKLYTQHVPCTHKRYGRIRYYIFTFIKVRDFDLLMDDS